MGDQPLSACEYLKLVLLLANQRINNTELPLTSQTAETEQAPFQQELESEKRCSRIHLRYSSKGKCLTTPYSDLMFPVSYLCETLSHFVDVLKSDSFLWEFSACTGSESA